MSSLPPHTRFSKADIAIATIVFVVVAVVIYAGVWQYISQEKEACRASCLEQGKLLGEYRPPSVNGRGGSGTQAQCNLRATGGELTVCAARKPRASL